MKVNATIQFERARVYLLDDCFDKELLQKVNQLFVDRELGWSEEATFAHNLGRLVYQPDNDTTQAINQYATGLTDTIGNLLGRAVVYQNLSLWLDLPGYRIAPHYDLPDHPEIAVQIYVGDPAQAWEMLGTAVYLENNRPLFEMHYRCNSGYLMEYPNLINHGLNHNIPEQFVRNSVYLRYRSQ